MKKTLLFCFAFLFAMATMAQPRAIILQESFDGSSMPAGWSTAGLGTSTGLFHLRIMPVVTQMN